MPRTSLFNFFARFTGAGIGDPKKRARFSDDIQLVSVVQDVSGGSAFNRFQSVAPTIMPSYGFSGVTPGPNRGILQLLAGPFGLWWTAVWMGTAGSFFAVELWTEAALITLTTETDIDPVTATDASAWGDGRNSASAIRIGDNTALASRPTAPWAFHGSNAGTRTGYNIMPEPTYIGPGRNLIMQHTGNGAQNVGFYWREPLSLPT